jgi:hypothetical protein
MIGRLKALLGMGLVAAAVPIHWPPLPASGFIAGRAATVEDVGTGNAAFSMQGSGRGPLAIVIPQYAWWTNEAGQRVPMIVIQAEIGPNGEEVVGMRGADGSETVATMAEVTLLGTETPR